MPLRSQTFFVCWHRLRRQPTKVFAMPSAFSAHSRTLLNFKKTNSLILERKEINCEGRNLRAEDMGNICGHTGDCREEAGVCCEEIEFSRAEPEFNRVEPESNRAEIEMKSRFNFN